MSKKHRFAQLPFFSGLLMTLIAVASLAISHTSYAAGAAWPRRK